MFGGVKISYKLGNIFNSVIFPPLFVRFLFYDFAKFLLHILSVRKAILLCLADHVELFVPAFPFSLEMGLLKGHFFFFFISCFINFF